MIFLQNDKKVKKAVNIENVNIFSNLIKGVSIGYTITAFVFIIYAVLITYTQITEKNTQLIVMITTVVSVIAAGLKTAGGAEKKGWLYGMLSGFLYAVIMIMLGIIIAPEVSLSTKTVMILVLSLAGGGLGGIVGINIKENTHS